MNYRYGMASLFFLAFTSLHCMHVKRKVSINNKRREIPATLVQYSQTLQNLFEDTDQPVLPLTRKAWNFVKKILQNEYILETKPDLSLMSKSEQECAENEYKRLRKKTFIRQRELFAKQPYQLLAMAGYFGIETVLKRAVDFIDQKPTYTGLTLPKSTDTWLARNLILRNPEAVFHIANHALHYEEFNREIITEKDKWKRKSPDKKSLIIHQPNRVLLVALSPDKINVQRTHLTSHDKQELVKPHNGAIIQSISQNSDGKKVALVSFRYVTIWDSESWKLEDTLCLTKSVHAAAFTNTKNKLAMVMSGPKVIMYDLNTKQKRVFFSSNSSITQLFDMYSGSLKFDPYDIDFTLDDQRCAIGCSDGKIKVYTADTFDFIHEISCANTDIDRFHFTDDGTELRFAVAKDNNAVKYGLFYPKHKLWQRVYNYLSNELTLEQAKLIVCMYKEQPCSLRETEKDKLLELFLKLPCEVQRACVRSCNIELPWSSRFKLCFLSTIKD